MFDFTAVVPSIPYILKGIGITVQIVISATIIGLILGILLALCKIGKITVLRLLADFYTSIFRGTPLVVQLLIAYYVLWPLLGITISPLNASIIIFGLNSAAYVSEIMRGGILSIDPGQMEAGRSLGMTWAQTMRYIIMPQAFKRIIPPLGNEFIAMLKDSSLVSVIGFEELTRRGQLIIARTYASFEIWMCVALIYLVMVFMVARFVAVLERKFETK